MSNRAQYNYISVGHTIFVVGASIIGLVLLGLILHNSTQVNNSLTLLATGLQAVITLLPEPVESLDTNPCAGLGTTLTVTKTAATFRTQTDVYTWNVTKEASSPQLTIIPHDTCEFLPPFNVKAHRTLATQSFRTFINGTITVTNGGAVATIGLAITDTLQVHSDCTIDPNDNGYVDFYGPVIVDVSSYPILAPGETHVYAYELDTALMVGYDETCTYRNTVYVTIFNHAGCIAGCPPNTCPLPGPCACGPAQNGGGVKAEVLPLNGITLIEFNEKAAIEDFFSCPVGLSCVALPGGLIQIPTTDVCTFDGSIADCVLFGYVCHLIEAPCDLNISVLDFVRLTTQDEATPQVVTSNIVSSPVYTSECPASGCTLTIGYWKTHAGFTGNNADRVSQYLPILLGCPSLVIPQYTKGANVTTAAQSTAILTFSNLLGGGANGLNKVAAQLLGTKLNVARNAPTPPAIVASIANADALLCQYGFNPGSWSSLSNNVKNSINQVATTLDNYNNGLSDVPHCI